jgi:hypothetical protein
MEELNGSGTLIQRWVVGAVLALGTVCAVSPARAEETADEFAAIDAHALAAPPSVTADVAWLSAYLVEPARTDREKARAIFRWITRNIAYDVSLEASSRDPEVVLTRRSDICLGYAALFKALAEAAGMRAEIIFGHSSKFRPGLPDESGPWVNHAWNAVEVDGRWQLVDCSWGAGHRDQQGEFVWKFCPHYFLTPPEILVYDHFPENPNWQLLAWPISQDEYLQRVRVRPPFFECGLRLVSHDSATIETDGPLTVTIGAPAETVLVAVLYRDGREVENGYTFTQREAEGFVIHARFPSAGAYVLRVFARRQDDPGDDYAWALDYTVQARSGSGNDAGFPQAYGSFLTRSCRLEQALSQTLPAGNAVEFSLTVPRAEEVVVASGGSMSRLPAEGARFTGKVAVSPGPVLVFARFAGQPLYEGLLQYTAR